MNKILLYFALLFVFLAVSLQAQDDQPANLNDVSKLGLRKYDKGRQTDLGKPIEVQQDGRCSPSFLSEFLDQQDCLRTPGWNNCALLVHRSVTTGLGALLGYTIASDKLKMEKFASHLNEVRPGYVQSRNKVRELGFAIQEIARLERHAQVEAGKRILIELGVSPEKYLNYMSSKMNSALPSHSVLAALYENLPPTERAKYTNAGELDNLVTAKSRIVEPEMLKGSQNRVVQNTLKTPSPILPTTISDLEYALWNSLINETQKFELTKSQVETYRNLEVEARKQIGESRVVGYSSKLVRKITELAQQKDPGLYRKLNILSGSPVTMGEPNLVIPEKHQNIRANAHSPILPPGTGTRIAGATAGAMAGAGSTIVLESAQKANVGRCFKALNLSPGEIEILENNSVNLTFQDCKSIRLKNPKQAIDLSYEQFGFVPKGLCSLIVHEDKIDKDFLTTQNLKIDKRTCAEVASGPFKIDSTDGGSNLECHDSEAKITYQIQLGSDRQVIVGQPGGGVITKAFTLDAVGQRREATDYAVAFESKFNGGVKKNKAGLSSDLTNITLRTPDQIYQELTRSAYEGRKPTSDFSDKCYSAYVGLKTVAKAQSMTAECSDSAEAATTTTVLPEEQKAKK